MKWVEFKKRAFPLDKKIEEDNRSIFWKINRYIGLRFAFLFNWLGFSANALSFFRFLLTLFGLYFISFVVYNNKWLPIIGAMLIFWQINLDTEEKVQIYLPINEEAISYNVKELLLSPQEDYLLFINKRDGLLYSLAL